MHGGGALSRTASAGSRVQIQAPLPRPADVFIPCLACRVDPRTTTGAHDVHTGCCQPPSTDTAPTPPAGGSEVTRATSFECAISNARIDRLRHPRGRLRWMQRCSEAVGRRGRALGWRPIMPPRAASGWWNASGAGLVRATTRPPSPTIAQHAIVDASVDRPAVRINTPPCAVRRCGACRHRRHRRHRRQHPPIPPSPRRATARCLSGPRI